MREFWIGFSTALITAVLYLTGYGFVHGFYKFYGISVNELNLGFQEILVRSFFALWRLITGPELVAIEVIEKIILIALLALFFYFLLFKIAQALREEGYSIGKPEHVAITSIATVAILLVTVSSSFVGNWVAAEKLRSLPQVEVYKATKSEQLSEIVDKENWYLYHLESTSSTHYLILRQAGKDFRWLIRIPNTADLVIQHFH
ncbi:MAG: hypothetical protein R8G60_05340 [Roseovarius pacificus]|nr:hypothetical protein [Roseovarius pacificus]